MARAILYQSVTPKIHVRNITVSPHRLESAITDDRHQPGSGITVTLNMYMRNNANNTSTSMNGIMEAMACVDIFLVQNFTPSAANSSRFSSDSSQSSLGTALSHPEARIQSISPGSINMRQALDSLSAGNDKIQYGVINLLESREEAVNVGSSAAHIAADSYEIPFEISFFIPDSNPVLLEYRIFTQVDARRNSENVGQAGDILPSLRGLGSAVTYEPVITEGNIHKISYIYRDTAGEVWRGKVHEMGDSTIMKGAYHGEYTGTNSILTRERVLNTKINDLRALTLPPVSDRFYGGDVYFDAKEYEREFDRRRVVASAFGLNPGRSGAKNLMSAVMEQLTAPKNRQTKHKNIQFDSELLLSTRAGNACDFLFTIDWAQIVKHQSRLASLYESLPPNQFGSVLRQNRVVKMSLYRRRMTDSPIGVDRMGNSAYKVFDTNEIPKLIAELSGADTDSFSMQEIEISWDSPGGSHYRTFTGTDTSMAEENYGNFQYYIDVVVWDGMASMLGRHATSIRRSIKFLKSFIEIASIPENSSPPFNTSHSTVPPEGSYNFETGRYTAKFFDYMTQTGADANLADAVRRYIAIYNILYGIKVENHDTLINVVSPRRSANIESLRMFLNLMEYAHDSITTLLNTRKETKRSDSSGAPMSGMTQEKGTFNFTIYFDELYDASVNGNLAVSYFENRSGGTGLKVHSVAERVAKEYVQFFADSNNMQDGAPAEIKKSGIKLTPYEYQFPQPDVLKNSHSTIERTTGFRKNSPEIGFVDMNSSYGNQQESMMRTLVAAAVPDVGSQLSRTNVSYKPPYVPPLESLSVGGTVFSKSTTNVLQTKQNFMKNIETLYTNIDHISGLGVSLTTPHFKNDTTWLQDFDENEEFVESPSILASSVAGSGENLCLDRNSRSAPQVAVADILNTDAFRFLELLSKNITRTSSGPPQFDFVGNLQKFQNTIEEARIENKDIHEELPIQLKSALKYGKEAPGILNNGDMSPFMFGMMVSIEEKTDTDFGKQGRSSRKTNFKEVRDISGARRSVGSKGGKFRICRLAPYENREVGISRTKSMEKTNVLDSFFLMEVR